MDPIRTVKSNFTYKGPTPDVGDLPCERQMVDGRQAEVFSVWEPNLAERALIAAGGQVKLAILTAAAIPPVYLEVVAEQKVEVGDPAANGSPRTGGSGSGRNDA